MRSIRKIRVLEEIGSAGVVGIIRTGDVAWGVEMGMAMIDGGVSVLEVSLTFPGALDMITEIAGANAGKDFILGAGTVSDAASARLSILAGAEFVVSHSFSEDVVVTCNRYSIACAPGIQTVSEAVRAMEMGCSVVKIFPGSVLGPGFIKAVHGPLPQLEMVAVGGVTPENLGDWFGAGAYAVGLGSALTKAGGADGTYEDVKARAEDVVRRVKATRSGNGKG